MREPLDSIDPFLWNLHADFLGDDCSDPVGEARARRIAETLASGRTGLYLEFQHVEKDRPKVSDAHYISQGDCLADPDRGVYRWLTQSEWDTGAAGRDFQSNESPLNPAMRQDAFSYRPDVARLFFDRLCELGPLLWLSEDSPTVNVPASVAVCPECGGQVLADVEDWNTETGEPITCLFDCAQDWLHTEEPHHRFRSSDWQSVRDTVERWARDTVRVRAGTLKEAPH